MKTKKFVKRLSLGKTTITNLGKNEQNAAKGGYWPTGIFMGCHTWHPNCATMPAYKCRHTLFYPECPGGLSEIC
jgi:hypothetical protein